ncbi:hypothetical protein FRC08_009004 [Ceratobasidium sp. 394]|nr:hypothetical protein FRC08_009004 [Ceratobasidium sp. 394]KAG9101794.1 hypothetical protein FS749_003097 [Ceratobasidium sp. UAMH 11750]
MTPSDRTAGIRAIGIDLAELRCNSRTYGLRRGDKGSKVSLSWKDDQYTIYREVRETGVIEQYSFDSGMIEECTHAKSAFNAIVVTLKKKMSRRAEWRRLAGDKQPDEIRLTFLAELTHALDEDSSSGSEMNVDESEDERAWRQLTSRLAELTCCAVIGRVAMRALVYPLDQKIYVDSMANVERKSLRRAQKPGGWFNDELINAGLRFVEKDVTESEGDLAHRTLFHSSHWWPLLDLGEGKAVVLERFQKIHKKDIFGLDYVIGPINVSANHWILCVICYPGNVVGMAHTKYVDNPSTDVKDRCTILLMDSIQGSADQYDRYFRIIREYLQVMAGKKINKPVKVLRHEIPPGWIVNRVVNVPQQPNTVDCGLYALYFARRFMALKDKAVEAQVPDEDIEEFWGACSGPNMRAEFRARLEAVSASWMEDQRL